MAATDDSGERFHIVRAHPDAEVGADAGALAWRCPSGESSDVVIEDGVLQALFEKRAGRAGSASAGLQSALQLLFVGRRGSAIALEQGVLEDRSEVGAGRKSSIVHPIHDGSFPMGQGGCSTSTASDITSDFRSFI
ncbi:hypothetical protein HMPREF9603_02553 [Cutibacterium acnes HL001PA1]|nr:hypothetical protein HMPREF9603_02553 [Cutibacterium acnes HL001PA1]